MVEGQRLLQNTHSLTASPPSVDASFLQQRNDPPNGHLILFSLLVSDLGRLHQFMLFCRLYFFVLTFRTITSYPLGVNHLCCSRIPSLRIGNGTPVERV